jgi:hypothetical protein
MASARTSFIPSSPSESEASLPLDRYVYDLVLEEVVVEQLAYKSCPPPHFRFY